jgi:hypothetical protein
VRLVAVFPRSFSAESFGVDRRVVDLLSLNMRGCGRGLWSVPVVCNYGTANQPAREESVNA